MFNTHAKVFRSALIGLGKPGGQVPALVVEPEPGAFPATAGARAAFVAELRGLAGRHAHTAGIRTFFFEKAFPVDVRHNAKIHRLMLKRKHDRTSSFGRSGVFTDVFPK